MNASFVISAALLLHTFALSAETPTYALSVGKADEERLEILNDVYNPFTRIILHRELKPGMSVLDVGCGIGIVSCEIAKLVGPSGKVTCVDISQEQLNLARSRAENQGLANIEFICLSAYDLDKLDRQYDVIYNRFLLMHVKDPIVILKKYLSLLNEGGLLFLEEGQGAKSLDCYPQKVEAIDRYSQLVEKQFEVYKTDLFIGRRLFSELQKLGCVIKSMDLAHPILRTSREKSLLRLGIQSKIPHLKQEDAQDAKATCCLLLDLEARDDVCIAYHEIVQVVAKKDTLGAS